MSLIANWSNYNRLTINFSKSNFMIFGNRSKLRTQSVPPSIHVDNKLLHRCSEFTYLGLWLNDELSMNATCNDLIKRVNHKIYTLSVLRKDMTTACAIRLYKAMILPLIDYPNFCLSPCTEKLKTKIQRLQNKALRICLRSNHLDSTVDNHNHVKLSFIDKRRDVNILKLIHWRIYSPNISEPNSTIFQIVNNSQSESVSTRLCAAPTIRLDIPTSGKICKSLLYYGSKL